RRLFKGRAAVLFLDLPVDLLTVHRNMAGRFDSVLHLIAAHIHNGDLDIVTVHNALVPLAGEYQHSVGPSLDAPPGYPSCRSAAAAACSSAKMGWRRP